MNGTAQALKHAKPTRLRNNPSHPNCSGYVHAVCCSAQWIWSSYMAYKDLREFLSVLETNGQLLRITEPALPEPDIASAACAGTKLGDQSPALLFENIKGYKTAKIAMNVHASWPNHALPIGIAKPTPLKDQFFCLLNSYHTYTRQTQKSPTP